MGRRMAEATPMARRLQATEAVVRFECRRTLTFSRITFALALALFPAALMGIIRFKHGVSLHANYTGEIVFILFHLIPGIVCLMGLLLWATPVLQQELEGRTWPYLAVRPCGKGAILTGKYLMAVGWTVACGLVSLTLSLAILSPEDFLRIWGALAALVVLASFAYGALFVLIGIMFLRRGLVVAVAYTFIVEFIVSFIPAIIGRLTIQYHLRCLLTIWVDLPWSLGQSNGAAFLSTMLTWQHLLVLFAWTVVPFCVATYILQQRQLIKTGET